MNIKDWQNRFAELAAECQKDCCARIESVTVRNWDDSGTTPVCDKAYFKVEIDFR
jgi:hypothetical protein